MSKVTSIEAIKAQAIKEVELPGWDGGEPFVARLKKPSMIALVAAGKIPNTLLGAAQELFPDDKKKPKAPVAEPQIDHKETVEVFRAVARASLVEPSYDELEEAGVELTDDQLLAIFNYSQSGVTALESFRKES